LLCLGFEGGFGDPRISGKDKKPAIEAPDDVAEVDEEVVYAADEKNECDNGKQNLREDKEHCGNVIGSEVGK
jgi:hypothetical protein